MEAATSSEALEESKEKADEQEPIVFKFMSYNILAEMYMEDRGKHLSDDSICRKSSYRRKRILAEIEQSNPDIICMQEVSYTDGTFKFFHDELTSMGYRVVILDHSVESGQDEQAAEESKQG